MKTRSIQYAINRLEISRNLLHPALRDGVHGIVAHRPTCRLTSGTIHNQIRWKSNTTTGKNRDRVNAALRSIQNEKQGGSIYGLKPVDYSVPPPIFRSPPPPPPKQSSKFVFPFTLAVSLGLTSYFYFYNKNDAHEYWVEMQNGGVLPGVFDDDDDDFDDDDDDEE